MKKLCVFVSLMLIAALCFGVLAEGLLPEEPQSEPVDAPVFDEEYLLGGEECDLPSDSAVDETPRRNDDVTEVIMATELNEGEMLESDLIYKKTDDGKGAIVIGYDWDKEPDETIVIPETLGGLPVVEISDEDQGGIWWTLGHAQPGYTANYYRHKVKSIQLPSTIKRIGTGAFCLLEDLETVNLPEGIESIGDSAFCATGIKSIKLPSTVKTVGDRAFSGMDNLTEVTVSASITSWGEGVFSQCPALEKVTIQEGLTTIPKSMFSEDRNLKSVSIPSTVTSIGTWAFSNCHALESITIPGSVQEIGANAFLPCDSLKEVILQEGVKTIKMRAFAWCSSLEKITIPASVEMIEDDAFSLSPIKEVHILGSDTPFNAKAFRLWEGNKESSFGTVIGQIEGITVYCPAGSSAAYSAKSAGYTVIETGAKPTVTPTEKPAATAAPTAKPTAKPTTAPTAKPTAKPTTAPTAKPATTTAPTTKPTAKPTTAPTAKPATTTAPTAKPTAKPTTAPTEKPGDDPTDTPDDEYRFYDIFVSGNASVTCLDVDSINVMLDDSVYGKDDFVDEVESSNDDIIFYSGGRFNAYKTGTAKAVIKTYNGKKLTISFTVVKSGKTLKLKLNRTKATVNVGSKAPLGLMELPVGTTNKKITWKSSDKTVAKVSSKGIVTALKKGSATITATVGGKSAKCKITVPTAPKSVTLYKGKTKLKKGGTLKLKKGKTLTLTAKLNSTKAKTDLTWTSDKPKIAKVTSGGKVKALKKGTATITVKTSNKKSYYVKIKVY